MPYIKTKDRLRLQPSLQELRRLMKKNITVGELNYLITMLSNYYLESKKESYATYNDIVGALESAKLEMYRRRVVNYEKVKIRQNGDVY